MSVLTLPSNLPVGFRFHPTDQELINDFLMQKIKGKHSQVDQFIAEVEICKWEPWDLPSKSRVQSSDKMWWFFCHRDYKYPSSTRSKRTTKTGYWKITGKERTIKGGDGKTCIGMKKNLVFYEGSSPGKKTNWVMQEYYIETDKALPHQRAYVICRLKIKPEKADSPDGNDGGPSGYYNSDFENQRAPPAIQGVHGHPEVNPNLSSQTLCRPNWYNTEQEMNLGFPNGVGDVYNFSQALRLTDEAEEHFVNSFLVDPNDNFLLGYE